MSFNNRRCEHCTDSNRTFALLPSCLMLLDLGVQWGLIVHRLCLHSSALDIKKLLFLDAS